jgi:serine protease Do
MLGHFLQRQIQRGTEYLIMVFSPSKEQNTRDRTLFIVVLVLLLVGIGINKGLHSSIGTTIRNALQKIEAAEHSLSAPSEGAINFVPLVKKLNPVVVNISAIQISEEGQGRATPFGESDPFNEFWRRFFGNPGGRSRQESLGSGFIVASDGYILTNDHVIEDAEKIVVKLSNDDREYPAKVIGKDTKIDIALIKISAQNLPVAPLGDSDRLQVGEWVLAIGNPFGLDSTVTSGIVSAKERHIGQGPYDSFIQTDAKINPGNSGGPLINMQGEIVGINTAIFSESGGSVGIGFAVPINMAKDILPQLKNKGKVTRGWMGVAVQRVTPDIAESMGWEKTRGALVSEVARNGPGERAGIKVGDLIVEYDGNETKDANDLPILVARTAPGKRVEVKVLRDKRELTIPVTLGELKEETVASSVKEKGALGLTVQTLTPEVAESLGVKRTGGVVITSVELGSVADDAGLQEADIIIEVNRKPIHDLPDYNKAIAAGQTGKGILFLIRRGENTLFVALKAQ